MLRRFQSTANTAPDDAPWIARLDRRIQALPQAAHIAPEHRRSWLRHVIDLTGGSERETAWHVARLRGFGGSEVGSLVLSRRGERPPFSTALDVVSSKLCLSRPTQSFDTERGHAAEPHIRDAFLRQTGAVPDREARAAFKGVTLPGLPWRVGNPDEVVLLKGQRWLLDYKAPRSIEDMAANGPSFEYVAQLHHYRGIAEALGVRIDRMAIVAFDYVGGFRPRRFDVPIDPHLEEELIEVGEHYWSRHVLAGALPDAYAQRRPIVGFSPSPDMRRAAADLAEARLVQQRGVAMEVAAKAVLARGIVSNGGLGASKLPLLPTTPKGGAPLLTVRAKPDIDAEDLARKMRAHGLDPAAYSAAPEPDVRAAAAAYAEVINAARQVAASGNAADAMAFLQDIAAREVPTHPGKLDSTAAVQALREAGGDPAPQIGEHLTVAFTRAENGPAAESLARLRAEVAYRVDEAMGWEADNHEDSADHQRGGGADEADDPPYPGHSSLGM